MMTETPDIQVEVASLPADGRADTQFQFNVNYGAAKVVELKCDFQIFFPANAPESEWRSDFREAIEDVRTFIGFVLGPDVVAEMDRRVQNAQQEAKQSSEEAPHAA